jgi:hypothetical protein
MYSDFTHSRQNTDIRRRRERKKERKKEIKKRWSAELQAYAVVFGKHIY